MSNTLKAYKIYKKYGQDGVLKSVNKGKLKFNSWKYCKPCEYTSPIYKNACLVCGSVNKKQ